MQYLFALCVIWSDEASVLSIGFDYDVHATGVECTGWFMHQRGTLSAP